MRTIPNPPEFRQNVGKQLLKICPQLSQPAVENMERSIYNYSLQEAGERNIVKKWDNPFFVQMYIDRLRAFYINLKESPELRQRLLSREIKPQDVGKLLVGTIIIFVTCSDWLCNWLFGFARGSREAAYVLQ